MRTHTIYYFQQNIGDLTSTLPSISVDINKVYLQFWLRVMHFSKKKKTNGFFQLKQGGHSLDHHFWRDFGNPLTQLHPEPDISVRWALFTNH